MKNWSVISRKSPCGCYTKGLSEYGSLEIEIVVPMKTADYETLCIAVKEAVEKGLKLEDGTLHYDFYTSPIFFFKTKSLYLNREIFRVIVLDEKGFFPWDIRNGVRCSEPYKSQISFEKNKVFCVEILNTDRVEELKETVSPFFCNYIKRNNAYATAFQYFMPNHDELIKVSPYMSTSNSVIKVLQDLVFVWGFKKEDIRISCRDVDFSDELNESFRKWVKRV